LPVILIGIGSNLAAPGYASPQDTASAAQRLAWRAPRTRAVRPQGEK